MQELALVWQSPLMQGGALDWQSPLMQGGGGGGLDLQSPLMQGGGGLDLQSPPMQELELSMPVGIEAGAESVRVSLMPLGAATAGSLIEESLLTLTAGRAPARERRPERVTRVV
jgi:hypothetical protein